MNRFKSILKVVLLILPLWYVISKTDLEQFSAKIASVSPVLIISAALILIVRIAIQSWRFALLTKPFTQAISFPLLLSADLKAKYYSLIIPSSVGQDIVRGTLLKEHLSADQTVGISLFFRLTGVLPLLALSVFGLFNLAGLTEIKAALPILGVMGALLVLFTVSLLSKRISKWFGSHLRPLLPQKVTNFIRQAVTAIQLYRGHGSLAVLNIGISIITQLLIVTFSATLLKAITGDFHFIEAITFIPVIEIVSILIPFAPNGVGVRELGYILMFNQLGESEESRALFLTLSLMMYLINLTGIVVILVEKLVKQQRKDKHEQ